MAEGHDSRLGALIMKSKIITMILIMKEITVVTDISRITINIIMIKISSTSTINIITV